MGMCSSNVDEAKSVLQALAQAALDAVAPDAAVLRHLRRQGDTLQLLDANGKRVWEGALSAFRRVVVLGAGKGAAPMAAALEKLLGDRIDDGLVVVKYGHDLPPDQALQHVRVIEAAHPIPDEAGAAGTAELVHMAETCAQTDLILCVITGGASALTPALCPGVTLDDLRTLTKQLLACGATIHEINTLRKHLSRFSGGNLARAAMPATLLSLIVSDVVGDDLDVIASGPTVPDSSTFATCMDIAARYELLNSMPASILAHFEAGMAGAVAETPKTGDPAFERVNNVLVATVGQAVASVAQAAEARGFDVRVRCTDMTGEAREQGLAILDEAYKARAAMSCADKPLCLLSGGECTVTLRGSGKGGRNQEMALTAALALSEEGTAKTGGANERGIYMLCFGTDGTDGPTDAAGGFAFSGMGKQFASLRAEGVDGEASLANNNSYPFLERAGLLLKTGPTRTNVMDVVITLVM